MGAPRFTVMVPIVCGLEQPPALVTVTVKAVFELNAWVVIVFTVVVLDVLPTTQVKVMAEVAPLLTLAVKTVVLRAQTVGALTEETSGRALTATSALFDVAEQALIPLLTTTE